MEKLIDIKAENSVERVLFDIPGDDALPRGTITELVHLLKLPEFDWRDIARAIDRLGKAAGGEKANLEAETVAAAAGAAILAMRKAAGSEAKAATTAARLKVQEACDPADPPETMLASVFKTLRGIVDCDFAAFYEYEDRPARKRHPTLLRARLAVDGKKTFTWPARWVEVDDQLVDWMKADQRRIDNLEAFYRDQPGAQSLADNPVVEEYRKRGATHSVSIPRIDGDRLWSAISLVRRADKPPFTQQEQDCLDRLGLDRIMRLASDGFAARQQRLSLDIASLFETGPEQEPQAIAQSLVDRIAIGFGWEYVAIFRVARVRGQFEIVAQHDVTKGKRLSVDPNYAQPLEGPGSGMLGKARRLGKTLCARNVHPPKNKPKGWRPPHNFVDTARGAQASAMSVPLFLGGEVEWLLDCESTQIDAFMEPDEKAITSLARDIERVLRLWFESRLNKALLDRVDQAVIVVDEKQQIERLNDTALKLLGTAATRGRKLADFAANDATYRALHEASALPGDGIRLALRDAHGAIKHVQASARAPKQTFSRRIWLFNEIAHERWGVVLDEMRQTVQDVAAQTRGPLLLAGALLRQAKRAFKPGDPADAILDRATRSLNKTDITYERLASSLEAISQPQREHHIAAFDIQSALAALVDTLPLDDQSGLDIHIPRKLPPLHVDAGRMAFALRSILGYLLAIRTEDHTLALRAGADRDGVWLTVAVAGCNPASIGPALTAALTAARTVVESHGARLSQLETKTGVKVAIHALPISQTQGPRP